MNKVFCKLYNKVKFEIRCFWVDFKSIDIFNTEDSFKLFPPSFYLRHTKEEAEAIEEREVQKLKDYLNSL